jgi:hypothetical protein
MTTLRNSKYNNLGQEIENTFQRHINKQIILPIDVNTVNLNSLYYLKIEDYNPEIEEENELKSNNNKVYKNSHEWTRDEYDHSVNRKQLRITSNIPIRVIDRDNIYSRDEKYITTNLNMVIDIDKFKEKFKIDKENNVKNLPSTCYFVIVPSGLNFFRNNYDDFLTSLSNNLKNRIIFKNNEKKEIDEVFVSDVKYNHEFAGKFLSKFCLNDYEKIEIDIEKEFNYDDNAIKKNIIKRQIINFFNDIHVLPCMHEIYDKAGNIASYFDVDTDCRYEPKRDYDDDIQKYIKDLTNVKKPKQNCDYLEVQNCNNFGDVEKYMGEVQYYKIDWELYTTFYGEGYRDERKSERKKCRDSNFLGIFFDEFIWDKKLTGGRKNRKTKGLRKNRKHKSRKYKNN